MTTDTDAHGSGWAHCVRVCWLSLLLAGCGVQALDPAKRHTGDSSTALTAKNQRPNFLLIVADDLGYSDLGSYGSEIRTPNLDQLAQSGLKFSQFYAAATCSPSRVMLMTGIDNHLAGLGNMGEQMPANQQGQPGYEGRLNQQVVTLPTLLNDAGYHTYMTGKWHLGGASGSLPHQRGFEHSFALIPGGGSHFADRKQILSVYPETLYLDDGERVESLPDDFYSSKDLVDHTIDYLQRDLATGQPFFAYVALTAPHWPLQVPDEYLDLYAGEYSSGYDHARQQRLRRMVTLGLVKDEHRDVERVPLATSWSDLNQKTKARSSRSMEIYAAMVERMDFHIGRLLNHLRQTGQLDNTVVVFLSDNGAEGNDRMKLLDNASWVPANFDLSLGNIGRKNSYAMQGAGWGQVSSGPFRFFKGYSTEGGLRVPFIVAGPGIPSSRAAIDALANSRDLAPTLLHYAGVDVPKSTYRGRQVHPMRGRSLRALWEGRAKQVYSSQDALGWEMFGHRSIRQGAWKILWADGRNGADGWQLFNVDSDPRETEDLSSQYPEKLKSLIAEWDRYVQDNGVILPDNAENLF